MIPSIKESIAKFKDYDFFVLTFDHSKIWWMKWLKV